VIGGTAAGENLTLSSTLNGTKGKILFGISAYDEANNRLGVGTASPAGTLEVQGSGLNDTIRLISTNATSGGMYFQNTQSTGQAVLYVENNLGSFAAYGGLLMGGSTNAIGNLFGLSRADRTFLFADGTSSLGLAVGTLTAQPLTLGTNNTARVTVASGGGVTLSSLGSGLVKSTSGLLANASASDIAAAQTWPALETILVSNGTASAPVGHIEFAYDTTDDIVSLSAGTTLGLYNLGSRESDTNYERVHAFWSSNVFNLTSQKKGSGTVREMVISSTAGVTVDDHLAVNGPTPAANEALTIGHTTTANRDHARFFLGGGALQDSPDNSLFDVFAGNTTIPAGRTTGIWAVQRIEQWALTGASSPTITEAVGLYIKAPTLSGASGSIYALHVATGATLLDGDLTTNSTDVRLNGSSNIVSISPNIAMSSGFGSSPALSFSSSVANFNLDGTVASATSARWEALTIAQQGAFSVTGATHVTTATGFNQVLFTTPQIATAATIDLAATIRIAGAPTIQSGGGAISFAYSLWVDDGATRLDGDIIVPTTANGTIPVGLGAFGPAGASTTPRAWLTVKDPAGTAYYLPLF
jgi:hypothetical protein